MHYYSDDGCAYLVPARPIRAAGPHGTLRPLARRGLQESPVGLPWPPAPPTRVRPGRGRTPRDPSGLPLVSSEKRSVLAAWPGLAWRPSRAPVSSSSDPAVNGGRAWAEGSPVCPAPALRPAGRRAVLPTQAHWDLPGVTGRSRGALRVGGRPDSGLCRAGLPRSPSRSARGWVLARRVRSLALWRVISNSSAHSVPVRRQGGYHGCGSVPRARVPWFRPPPTRPARGSPYVRPRTFTAQSLACGARLGSGL
jgi:hypothetical protein